MKLEDIKIGMRVVPTSKTAAPEGRVPKLENSARFNQAKSEGRNWLYVIAFSPSDCPGEIILSNLLSLEDGDYFMAADVELYKCEHQ